MKIRSSVNRRSFGIEPAGFFNVLRPHARFTASHLRRVFPYLPGRSKGTDNKEAAKQLQIMTLGRRDGGVLRWTFIILAAIGITLGFFKYLQF